MLYEARYYGQTSSARLYTGSHKISGFTKKPTAEEQLNEKQLTNELVDQRESGRIERSSTPGDRKAAVGEHQAQGGLARGHRHTDVLYRAAWTDAQDWCRD